MAVFNNILAGAAGSGDAPAFSLEKSVRLNDGDDAYLSKTIASAGNRKTWTLSCWFKLGNPHTSYQNIFSNLVGNTNGFYAYFGSDILYINDYNLTGGVGLNTTRVFRDKLAWYHLVIRYDTTQVNATDRTKVYINGVQEPMLGYYPNQNVDGWWNNAQLAHIGRQSDNVPNYNFDGYLADIHFIDGQSLGPTEFGEFDGNNVWQAKQFTGTYGNNGYHLLDFANESGVGDDSSGNNNDWTPYNINDSSGTAYGETVSAVHYISTGSDISHVLNANLTDHVRVATSNYGNTYYTVTFSNPIPINSSVKCRVLCPTGASGMFRIRINDTTNTILPDNNTISDLTLNLGGATSLSKLDFRTYNGTQYGANLYYIEVDGNIIYADSVLAETDVFRDVPTNGTQSDTGAGGEVSGNYATLNPSILGTYISSRTTLSNGNLKFVNSNYATLPSTIAMSSGKWYCEGTLDAAASAQNQAWAGLLRTNAPNDAYEYFTGNSPEKGVHYWGDSTGLNRTQSYGIAYNTPGTVIGIAFDADAGSCTWYVNGSSQGSSTYNIVQGEEYFFSFGAYVNGAWTVNFGARPFAYSAPSGYKALCTTNLPDPTIADGSDYFETVTWTGTGASKSLTTGFSPDFIWLKNRTISSNNRIFDTVRGVGNMLHTNTNDSDQNDTNNLTSFDSSGFTVGTNSNTNGLGNAIVAWNWDAGSSTVSNTDGSVTSSVRANPSAGFSIVSWTSSNANGNYDTIGHGLNALPGLVITKRRTVADQWYSAHGFDLTQFAKLNTTDAFSSAGTAWGNGHTSSVISLRVGNFCGPSENLIAYCWAPVEGYSSFGSYQGNGSSDGAMIVTGFRPAFLMLKRADGIAAWYMYDYKRDGYNAGNKLLYANYPNAEANNSIPDLLSNGFKIRTTGAVANASGGTYTYVAFAENPFSSNGGLAR